MRETQKQRVRETEHLSFFFKLQLRVDDFGLMNLVRGGLCERRHSLFLIVYFSLVIFPAPR